jgi:hypothetical protein
MQLVHALCVAVTQFLTEAGVFMHFGDTHLDLGSLYFLDPCVALRHPYSLHRH